MYNKFLENEKSESKRATYREMVEKIKKINPSIEEWTEKEVDEFLYSYEATSVNSLQKYYQFLNHIYQFCCKEKGCNPSNHFKASKILKEYLSYERLRETIITPDDFNFLRNEILLRYGDEDVNYRDKLIFELAWLTLTSKDILNLKEKDIEVFDNKAKINLSDRIVWVDDPVIMEDIKKTINERIYYNFKSDGRLFKYSYRFTPYLIKPINTRPDYTNEKIGNLPVVFKSIMKRLSVNAIKRFSKDADGTEHALDVSKFSIATVRRSGIIALMSGDVLSVNQVSKILGKKQQADMAWMKPIARRIYGVQ